MREPLILTDVMGDVYRISDEPMSGVRPNHVSIIGDAGDADMLFELPEMVRLRDWLDQWLAEQGQEAGEEADDGRVS